MVFNPRTHTITVDEIDKASKIGLKFINLGDQPNLILNEHFPNFELFTFFSSISKILTPLCDDSGNINMVLGFSTEPELTVQFYTDNVQDDALGLGFSRIFSIKSNELIVKHDFFRLPKKHRGKGIAKEIIKLCLQQYINMGVQKIMIHAALTDGGYAWALYYFTVPEKSEIDIILGKARQTLQPSQYNVVEKVYDNYYNQRPDGKAFPIVKWAEIPFMKDILRGSDWNGLIDLNNQEQFRNFILYATT